MSHGPDAAQSPGSDTGSTRTYARIVVALALAASLAILGNDFVFDDAAIIRDDIRLHSLGNIGVILSSPYWPAPYVEQLWRPLTSTLLSLQYAIGGGSPVPFRLVTLLLYATSAWCFWVLARQLLPVRAAFAAAALYAVHPVHVEAVAQAVNQADLIVGIAALSSLTAYIKWRRRGPLHVRQGVVLAGLAAVGGLAKESGLVIPGIWLAAECVLFRAQWSRGLLRSAVNAYLPAAGSLALIVAARTLVLDGHPMTVQPANALSGLTLPERVAFMLGVVPTWLRLLAWPARLSAEYAVAPAGASATLGATGALGLALVGSAIAAAIAAVRRSPIVTLGLLICAATLAPVSNLIPTGVIVAERTLLLPSAGFLLAAISAVCFALDRAPRRATTRLDAATMVLVGLLALGLVKSVNRASLWNSRSLVVVPRQGS